MTGSLQRTRGLGLKENYENGRMLPGLSLPNKFEIRNLVVFFVVRFYCLQQGGIKSFSFIFTLSPTILYYSLPDYTAEFFHFEDSPRKTSVECTAHHYLPTICLNLKISFTIRLCLQLWGCSSSLQTSEPRFTKAGFHRF